MRGNYVTGGYFLERNSCWLHGTSNSSKSVVKKVCLAQSQGLAQSHPVPLPLTHTLAMRPSVTRPSPELQKWGALLWDSGISTTVR